MTRTNPQANSLESRYLPFRDPEFRHNPYPYYQKLRRDHPWLRLDDGTLMVSRYADVAAVLFHRRTGVQELDFGVAEPLHGSVLGMDAPDHTRMRRISNRFFTPKAIRNWLTTMRESVDAALATRGEDGEIEAVRELAMIPTYNTVCRIFDVPADGFDLIRKWTYDTALSLGPGADAADNTLTSAAMGGLEEFITRKIADKRQHPGDGLADALIAAQAAGNASEHEVIRTLQLFYAVGHLDVGYLIANGLRLMSKDPELVEVYRDQPEARHKFINEVVRWDSPEQSVTRMAMEDLDINGTVVPAGTVMILLLGSANKDPDAFADPERFDWTRPLDASRQLSFGAGAHSCAGQLLARGEADTVFTALVERFRSIERAGAPIYNHTEFLRSIVALPLRLR